MPKRIIDLPKVEWRARCLADANAISELSLHLDMCREDGDPPEQMTVRKILAEARDALSYYENGTAADSCEAGDKQALKDRRELRAFITKWTPRLEARAAAFHAVRATAGK
jgi:hypothetical protein